MILGGTVGSSFVVVRSVTLKVLSSTDRAYWVELADGYKFYVPKTAIVTRKGETRFANWYTPNTPTERAIVRNQNINGLSA